MRIGDKITVTRESLKNGYTSHSETAIKYLQIGEIYNVQKVDIDAWHTDVYLEEFPGVAFNSVCLVPYKTHIEYRLKKDIPYCMVSIFATIAIIKAGTIIRNWPVAADPKVFLQSDHKGPSFYLATLEENPEWFEKL